MVLGQPPHVLLVTDRPAFPVPRFAAGYGHPGFCPGGAPGRSGAVGRRAVSRGQSRGYPTTVWVTAVDSSVS